MIEKIKKLRAETGAPLEAIRSALAQSGGDEAKARKLLTKFAKLTHAKKASLEAKAGLVEAYTHMGRIGVVLEVNCETDFVARNDEFRTFVHELAMHIAAADPKNTSQLLTQPFIKDETMTVADRLVELTGKLGEKIVVKRFERYELGQTN
ncbi:elongation factor Ts [Candidatus Berkelbacteria bacterium]|nr:elongation factor Ts [Candidatus Berkelbacteria bacterium]